MWDLALLGIVPGAAHRGAARRDRRCAELLREAVAVTDGPTVLRYPKTPLGADIPAVAAVGTVDVLAEPDAGRPPVDVLLVAVGAMAGDVLAAPRPCGEAGYTRPGRRSALGQPGRRRARRTWPRQAGLVVTVEDGVAGAASAPGSRQTLRDAGLDGPTREIGIPVGSSNTARWRDVRADVGLTVAGHRTATSSSGAAKLASGEDAARRPTTSEVAPRAARVRCNDAEAYDGCESL